MPRVRGSSTRIFVTAPYEEDGAEQLRAKLPARCPFAGPGETNCELRVHHRRARATGPCCEIDVVRCATHRDHCFSLYPPGHFPYGRKALVNCSGTGPPLTDGGTGKLTWDGTVLEAAHQAASGDRWPADSAGASPGVRRTQGRHLELAGLVLGVHPALSSGERERIATRLRVPTMALHAAASRWWVSWTERGTVIVEVLSAVLRCGSLLDRLLSAGYSAGLWARARRWVLPGAWIIARSTAAERTPEAQPNSRAPPSSNLLGAPAR